MLCEYCNLKPATVILKQNIDGEMKTVHICRDCAQSLGVTLDKINVGEVMNDMDSFFASMFGKKSSSTSKPGTNACDFCGMTLTELQKTGKAGCANCYNVFADVMDNAIRRIHASSTHCGKVPASVDGQMSVTRKIEELKAKLNVAVQNEEYEIAATIRDEIKALQAKGEEKSEQKLV